MIRALVLTVAGASALAACAPAPPAAGEARFLRPAATGAFGAAGPNTAPVTVTRDRDGLLSAAIVSVDGAEAARLRAGEAVRLHLPAAPAGPPVVLGVDGPLAYLEAPAAVQLVALAPGRPACFRVLKFVGGWALLPTAAGCP